MGYLQSEPWCWDYNVLRVFRVLVSLNLVQALVSLLLQSKGGILRPQVVSICGWWVSARVITIIYSPSISLLFLSFPLSILSMCLSLFPWLCH